MRFTAISFAICAVVTLAGCAAHKNFYAVDGSRADGTVDMAYDFAQFEKPIVNKAQADDLAKQKCAVWGYSAAEPFGGQSTNCQQRDGWGNCIAGQVVIKYQCISNLDAAETLVNQATTTSSAAGGMTKEQWRQHQLLKLQEDTSLTYEQYSARRQQILAE